MVTLCLTIHAVWLLLLWNFCDICGLLQNVKRNMIFFEQNSDVNWSPRNFSKVPGVCQQPVPWRTYSEVPSQRTKVFGSSEHVRCDNGWVRKGGKLRVRSNTSIVLLYPELIHAIKCIGVLRFKYVPAVEFNPGLIGRKALHVSFDNIRIKRKADECQT